MLYLKKISLFVTCILLMVGATNVSSQADYQQQAFLKASNPDVRDWFGYGSVVISGDTLVISTPKEDSFATGVNGDESNNNAGSSGAVYVFVRIGNVWSQQAYLKASNTDASDNFGEAVAIAEDTIVVGAPEERSSATGVNGDESNNDASASGAAYVFTRNAGVWSQQAYLKASNSEAGDRFGSAVGISGERIVVGAAHEKSSSTVINGDENLNDANNAGAVYVFIRNAGIWSQEAYLKASNTDFADYFGIDVAISDDSIVVGAYREASNSIGVNGDESNNDANTSGAAYVFNYSAGSWQQQAYLKASNTDELDRFGSAVDISENTIVIGAYREDSSSSGINADGRNNGAESSGAAYVFTRDLDVWSQQAYLKASNTDEDDFFGHSVAVSNNTIVIGAFGEGSAATGVNGDENNNDVKNSGAAYVFIRSAGNWSQQHYLKSEFPEGFYYFGGEVGVSENTVVISETSEGSIVSSSGAAYVFNQPCSYDVSVEVSGLLSTGLVLQNNGTDDLSIMDNGVIQLAPPLVDKSIYQVFISNQPDNSDHTCIIDGNSQGVIASANVLIKVRCADFIFVDDFE